MAHLPREPEAFAEQVRKMLHRMRPELSIEHTGPRELIVCGRRLDLENLMRLVRSDEANGVRIVEQYLDHLFDESSFGVASMPWEVAQARIMPRIQPVSIFEHLSKEQVAHVPWVNDTVIVFVIDLPNMTVSVTTEQMLRWGAGTEELELLARENLAECSSSLEFRAMDSEEGGRAVLLAMQDGYDASRLLLRGIYESLAPRLGGDFLVAAPSRDMFMALTRDPGDFVDRVQSRVESDYRRLPYPITDRLFYVTRDGVAGTPKQAA